MKKYGLLGYPLTHSFSKKYFAEKFEKENINDCEYHMFEYEQAADFVSSAKTMKELAGFNITIPHKISIIPYLDEIKDEAHKAGAVNVVKITKDKKFIGYNSDYFGFRKSLEEFIGESELKALILGTGGASKAVAAVLQDKNIPFLFVSRKNTNNEPKRITYQQVNKDVIQEHQLIINTTPLGMYPKIDTAPELPYKELSVNHFLFDLVYNPEVTTFLQNGINQGTKTKNGLDMLYYQAEKAWEIWND